MNDFDLDSQLKALRTPERDEEYWADFPGRVTRELRRRPLPRPVRFSWMSQLAWGFSLAFGCFALGYFLGHDDLAPGFSRSLLRDQSQVHMSLVTFPERLRAFLENEHDLQKLAPDQP